jgi:hypothetical protein
VDKCVTKVLSSVKAAEIFKLNRHILQPRKKL